MGVKIGSTSGYFWLDSWVLANIIQLGTISFCRRFLTKSIDPCGRQYDQMTQAARSSQANIAEGSSRHQTSVETEMRLTDVSRASVNELSTDYLIYLMSEDQVAWRNTEPNGAAVRALRLDQPQYGEDLLHDVSVHILTQKKKFDPWINSVEPYVVANTMLILCSRLNSMLTKQIEHRLKDFKLMGGFTENMTAERVESLKTQAIEEGAPLCPNCGKPMLRRTAKKGRSAGNQFWSCSDFPNCYGTRPI